MMQTTDTDTDARRAPATRPERDDPETRRRLPSVGRVGLARGEVEIKQFFREKQAWIFTLAFPPILLSLFGTIFSAPMAESPVGAGQYFLPVMMAFGVMSASFMNLAIGLAVDRDDGTLKRLRGAPVPPTAYFLGKMLLVLSTTVVEVALLLVIALLVFRTPLPTSGTQWATFAWVMLLGLVTFALLGVAASRLAGSARNAAAVINLPFMLLMFVSGVFIPYNQLPTGVQTFGALFPAKWFAQGLRSVFLPDSMLVMEPAGSWQHGLTALVMGAWCIGGLVLCLRTFRWSRDS